MSDSLDDKLRAFEKEHRLNEQAEAPPELAGAGASRIGYELLIASLFFGFIGYLIDQHFHTMPLFSLVLFFVGFGAGVYNAWRIMNGAGEKVGFRKK